MKLPGGIRTTIAIALLAIVGGALGGAYLMVVPSLERRLVEDRLDELRREALATAYSYARTDLSEPFALDSFVVGEAFLSDARTVVFQVFGPPLSLRPLADSSPRAGSISNDTVALETAQTSRVARGRVERRGRPFAEVAVPLFSGDILLLSTPIEDQLATVRVVKRRLLYATGVALAIAAILGGAAASLHARRIRRLERAANRIAQGEFDEPVVDLGGDELGELAAAFERMRVQLAQLDTARKEFVANASHELRTPLFSLAGFLELMADEDLDEETRAGFLATTREQVERLTKLSADLLDLSRMDAGRLRVEREEVSLADMARLLADEVAPLAEATGHAVTVEADPDAWAVADEERVLQIGRALIANALSHTPSGHRGRRHGDEGRRPGDPRRPRRRSRDPARARRAHLRSLLPGRRRAGIGQRARSRDRARARGPHGGHGRAEQHAGADDVHALAPGRAPSRSRSSRFPRENAPARPVSTWKRGAGGRKGRCYGGSMRASVAVAVAAARRRGRGGRGDPRRVGRRSRGLDHDGRGGRPGAGDAQHRPSGRRRPPGRSIRQRSTRPARTASSPSTRTSARTARRRAPASWSTATGAILTNAHVITNVAELEPGSAAPVRAASAVYVEFSDGERVKAKIVGWDLFSDVGVIRVTPADHALAPLPLGDLPRRRRGRAGGRDRKPLREADVPLRRRRLRHRPLDRLAHLGVHGRERDPDRRADQPGELRRPALRRRRPRDRHQRADPEHHRDGGRRRVRDPDRHRPALARPARADRARALRVHRHPHAGRDARASPPPSTSAPSAARSSPGSRTGRRPRRRGSAAGRAPRR